MDYSLALPYLSQHYILCFERQYETYHCSCFINKITT